MTALIVVPSDFEYAPFIDSIHGLGHEYKPITIGRIRCVEFDDLGFVVALGGFGKTQFGIQTQHLLQARTQSSWECVVVAGAAGALINHMGIGDIVVGSKTVEYDMKFSSGKPPPEFSANADLVRSLNSQNLNLAFPVRLAPIASGDQDVVDPSTRARVHSATGAAVVAWEGAGGARAALFNDVPFTEVRAVSDKADSTFSEQFEADVALAMGNLATLIVAWREGQRSGDIGMI